MQFKRGGWPYSHPPNTAFELNTQSPQAKGLVAWWPTVDLSLYDRLRGALFSKINTPEWTISRYGPIMQFDDSGLEHLVGFPSPVTQTPSTLSAWFVFDDNVSTWTRYGILTVTDPAVGDFGEYHWIYINTYGTVTNWNIRAETRDSAGSSIAGASITGVLGDLYHIVGVFRSPTDREVYLNAVSLATDNTSRTPTGIDRMIIGGKIQWENPISGIYGLLRDARIYNRALSAAEIYDLYQRPWHLYLPQTSQILAGVPGAPPVVRMPRHPAAYYGSPTIF